MIFIDRRAKARAAVTDLVTDDSAPLLRVRKPSMIDTMMATPKKRT
jgi:hypothetical protein